MRTIQTDKAPQAIGPYCQGMVSGNMFFSSGQIPLAPNGEKVSGGIEEQTRQVFANLRAVLNEAGVGLDKVIKATVFVTDLADFSSLNSIFAQEFGNHKPARSTVQVARLPMDVEVEIEVIALID
ncbi:RidA family protein [Pseudohalocynthiibacter aestuariivivens]|uniref:RidA family protein n=1 Tax=Pseudohalocynthiibacter aestuariivivens TaxID=1591409 RepID=A0ABV5JJL7_9RHOB|nr:RidA family protein [Pseudohalocynthiibacter aestuariivivens]MBS9715326.1 RidA family protein [Pseudohalocynthiibacter aestuariivivens]